MRVVVDTNVLISSQLTPHGPASVVVGLALARVVQPLVDGRMLDEYDEVLRRPEFAFRLADVAAFLDRWQQGCRDSDGRTHPWRGERVARSR